MKSMKKTVMSKIAKVSLKTAVAAGNTASYGGCYQPKEPACLKKFSK